jgi:PAS domain S-box-containing protein
VGFDLNEQSQTAEAVIEMIAAENELTNAEIAERVGTTVAVVRDMRNEYRADDTATDEQSKGILQPEPAPAAGAATASKELVEQYGSAQGGWRVLDSLHDGVVKVEIVGDEPIVCSVNQAFVDTFGHSAADIIGEPLNERIVPDEYAAAGHSPSEPDTAEPGERRVVTRQADDCVREFLRQEIPHEADGNQYVFRIFTDITGQKRREVEREREIHRLKAKNHQLEQKREELEQFASILSHDLRNPISIAEGYLTQVKSADNTENVEVIERALDRMNALIDDTLTLKDESQPVEAVSQHSIATIAESAWEFVDTGESQLRVVDRFEMRCHEDRFSRLLENLFRNAIDHNEEPVVIRVGVHDTLTTSTRGDTKNGFFVSDDGCGIPEEKRDQMFEIGETTTRTGTGLGLPIIKRIAEAHGWNVQLVESFDGGAKFVFMGVDIS